MDMDDLEKRRRLLAEAALAYEREPNLNGAMRLWHLVSAAHNEDLKELAVVENYLLARPTAAEQAAPH
jgi:hypothetical protein